MGCGLADHRESQSSRCLQEATGGRLLPFPSSTSASMHQQKAIHAAAAVSSHIYQQHHPPRASAAGGLGCRATTTTTTTSWGGPGRARVRRTVSLLCSCEVLHAARHALPDGPVLHVRWWVSCRMLRHSAHALMVVSWAACWRHSGGLPSVCSRRMGLLSVRWTTTAAAAAVGFVVLLCASHGRSRCVHASPLQTF